MLLILVIAIAGAALYGDQAYDYAQQQLASGDDAPDVSEQRAILDAEDEIDGLTFEESQALTPFDMAEPLSLPEGASIVDYRVSRMELGGHDWAVITNWRSTTEISLGDDGSNSILLRQQPAMQHLAIPMPQDDDESDLTGRLEVIEIAGTGAVQVIEHAEGGEIISHYVWRQGDVDLWLEIPFDVTESDSPVEGLDQTIASIIGQGALDDGGNEIANRGMTLAQLRETMPTVPVADPTPEHLELRHADISMYGPHFSYEHTTSADVDDIWIRAMGATGGMHFHERVADAVSETVDFGDLPVSQHILMDRFAPEASEFIEIVGLHVDLLLPWISGESDTALAIYMWDVAGQGYLMGVQIPRQRIDIDGDDPVIATDRPESDWLEIIAAQEAFAAEHLDLEEIFPVFAEVPIEQDQFPDVSYMSPRDGEDSRLIRATSDSRYYLAHDDDRNMIMLYQFVEVAGEDAPRSSGGGNALWHAAEHGIYQEMGGGGSGPHIAWMLPQGYDEVVDEEGQVIDEVEDQLFAASFGDEPRPRALIARGPAGELYLDPPSAREPGDPPEEP